MRLFFMFLKPIAAFFSLITSARIVIYWFNASSGLSEWVK